MPRWGEVTARRQVSPSWGLRADGVKYVKDGDGDKYVKDGDVRNLTRPRWCHGCAALQAGAEPCSARDRARLARREAKVRTLFVGACALTTLCLTLCAGLENASRFLG
jgi:hypothetical protein